MAHTTAVVIFSLLLASSAHHVVAAAGISKRHVQLVTPQPFAWDEYGPTNPLSPDGSDYPCKVPQGDTYRLASAPTEMVVGEAQQVSFAGWAVHGGGSCQFALAEGLAPTKDTPWKVIHSIEGGCPKANVSGNLPQGDSPDTYDFSVPADFAPGNYTFAWTWVNRIAGSPEFYMNCAPITVKAPASTSKRADKKEDERRRVHARTKTYPDLFLANIGEASNGCTTEEALKEQVAIAFPYPGDSVSHPNGVDAYLFDQPCDGNPRHGGGSAATSGGGGASAQQPSKTASAMTTPTVPTTSRFASSAASAATTSTESSLETTSSSVAASTSQIVATTRPSTSTSSAAASTTTTSSLSDPCTDGHLLCVGGTQFSTCTGGKWNAPQNLAQGTTCKEEGESSGLDTTYHWD